MPLGYAFVSTSFNALSIEARRNVIDDLWHCGGSSLRLNVGIQRWPLKAERSMGLGRIKRPLHR
jgi:hypothetical protein